MIELLIVIAVLAILATIAFIAIDPLSRFQDARNAKRSTDVNEILNAIKMYQVDHKGAIPLSIEQHASPDVFNLIGTGSSCNQPCYQPNLVTEPFCVDLTDLVTAGYLPSVPQDPSSGNEEKTGYYLEWNANKTFTVGTCVEEQGSSDTVPEITATR